MSISRSQCRSARALLDWTQSDLARASAIALRTILDFESGKRTPYKGTLLLLRQAFEAAGIEFIPEDGGGEGVRFRVPRAMREGSEKTVDEKTADEQ